LILVEFTLWFTPITFFVPTIVVHDSNSIESYTFTFKHIKIVCSKVYTFTGLHNVCTIIKVVSLRILSLCLPQYGVLPDNPGALSTLQEEV